MTGKRFTKLAAFYLCSTLVLFSSAAYAADSNPSDVCAKLKDFWASKDDPIACSRVITQGSNFDPHATGVCRGLAEFASSGSPIECLKIVKDAKFQDDAVDVCGKLTSWFRSNSDNAVDCMKTVRNQKFDPYFVQFCSKIAESTSTSNSPVGCLKMVKDARIQHNALDVCTRMTQHFTSGSPMECLRTVANARFQDDALDVCGKLTRTDSEASPVDCLNEVKNQRFDPEIVKDCSKETDYFTTRHNPLQCLQQANLNQSQASEGQSDAQIKPQGAQSEPAADSQPGGASANEGR